MVSVPTPDSEPCVLTSGFFFDPDIFNEMEYEDIKYEDLVNHAVLCADTFTEFLWRFWIENTIWYSRHSGLQLTPIQDAYSQQVKSTTRSP